MLWSQLKPALSIYLNKNENIRTKIIKLKTDQPAGGIIRFILVVETHQGDRISGNQILQDLVLGTA